MNKDFAVKLEKYKMLFVFIGMIIIASLLTDRFLTVSNISNIMRQVAVNGILACGMTFVMLTGGFDLSVGSIVTLTGATALSMQPVLGVGGAILLAIMIGAAAGSFNGAILSKINANSGDAFMITLGSQLLIFGVSLLAYNARFIPGSRDPFYMYLGTGNLLGFLPVPLLIFFIVALLSHLILWLTPFGRKVYLTGGNYEAARLSGIKVGFYKMFVYVIAGATAAISAIVLTSRSMGSSSDLGKGYELDAIAAVIVGGISLEGGEGSIVRTVLGVFIIGVLSNILNLMGMSSFNQMIVKGIVITAAVWLDRKRVSA